MAARPDKSAAYRSRREEIIDLAAKLFADKGYAATGIGEIGDAIGLGRGTLYYYIVSKENLLVAIQDRVLGPLLQQGETISALEASPLVRLRLLSEVLLSLILTRADHVRVYEHDFRQLTGTNRERVVDQRHEFEQLVQALIEEAIAEGSLRPGDPRLAALQFLNLHNYTYQWARTASREWSASELSREYMRTLLMGMAVLSPDELTELEVLADAIRHNLAENQSTITAASPS